MAKSKIAQKHFHDEDAARAWFEAARWPDGPICPNCGNLKHYATKKVGRYRCGEPECRKDFTVMTKTVMERSHAPLTNWAYAFTVAADGKKGFSAHQLMRQLGCQYNTAWFLHHRVMEAMRRGGIVLPPMGGDGKIVEADETYFGKPEKLHVSPQRRGRPYLKGNKVRNSRPVVALVERGGNIRTFHIAVADKATVSRIVMENVAKESRLHTDESKLYTGADAHFATHETVKHSAKEYARGDVNTNSAEGFFSIFKCGMKGVYQHCAEKNLHRYLAEFEFRYNTRKITDGERAVLAIRGGEGKRLTYR
jgi:transposase-like protein